jgi:hypothetical protein
MPPKASALKRIVRRSEFVTTIAASMNCTKIVECCRPEAQATIFSCGPTAPLVVPRERIVAAQLDI